MSAYAGMTVFKWIAESRTGRERIKLYQKSMSEIFQQGVLTPCYIIVVQIFMR